MSTSEIITFTANLALTLSFIVALIFGIAQVRAAERDRKERFTLETLRRFQTRDFAELIYFATTKDIPPTFEGWQKMPAQDRIMFIHFSQEMESLGLLVAEKFIDLDLVDKTLGAFVVTSWERFTKVVVDSRKKVSDPFLNEYFEWLAERLNEEMKMNPRKPFGELN